MKRPHHDENAPSHPEHERAEVGFSPEPMTESAESPLERLERELAELQDKNARLSAELLNQQKRLSQQSDRDRKFAVERLARDILPCIDNLEAALTYIPNHESAKEWRSGVELTLHSLLESLKRHGVVPIESSGTSLNPEQHEAVSIVPVFEKEKHNLILEVLQRGYALHERVLRPSRVVVGQFKEESENGASSTH